MSYSDKGCTGGPLYPGSARGTRVFQLDVNGWLRGVTYKQVWLPGENSAACFKVTQPANATILHTKQGWFVDCFIIGGYKVPLNDLLAAPEIVPGFAAAPCEAVGSVDCACGFYAYHAHDSTGTYGVVGPGLKVNGVIEGYGRVTLGAKGFRASKAKIVALVVPDLEHIAVHRRNLESAIGKLELDLKRRNFGAQGTLAMGGLAGVLIGVWPVSPVAPWLSGALAVFAAVCERYSWLSRKEEREEIREQITIARKELEAAGPDYEPVIAVMKEHYPEAAFFNSYRDMKAEFPVENLSYLLEGEGDGDE